MESLTFDLLSTYWSRPEVTTNVIIFFNLLGSLALGLLVGYERSYRGRAAGMRTYGLVCMASAAVISATGFHTYWYGGLAAHDVIDPARVIQGVVTGIGFLGAGIIMKDGLNISGLTTAASIWASSAIGVLVGVGFYAAAILLALLSATFMMWGSKIDTYLPMRHAVSVAVTFKKNFVPREEDVRRIAHERGYEIAKGTISIIYRNEQAEWRFVGVSMGKKRSAPIMDLATELPTFEGVESFHLSHARN